MTRNDLLKRYAAGERDFHGADLRWADLRRADLCWADLRCANLRGANLRGANLRWADLRGASLSEANLRGADLYEANLREASLCCANLRGANLRGANLREADLGEADLRGADLPSPTTVLLAYWGNVSDLLCTELMRYDAANHPDGDEAFTTWKETGVCPYNNCHVQRAANFEERRDLWSPGPAKSAYELMCMVLDEKCTWRDDETK